MSKLTRRDLIKTGGAAASIAALPATAAAEAEVPNFVFAGLSVTQLQERLSEGSLTSAHLTKVYLRRIEAIDRSGPTLRSVIEVNPEAMEIAELLDRERAEGKVRGPLHGIPVMVKDNLDTADKMMTTAGSLALVGARPKRDCGVVQRLREAGAVLLGKTNLSEWANFRSNMSSSGWSGRGGQVKNPYVLDRNPCGSSSGSGAAVAADLCTIAIGTETNGSVVCPSNANSLVGIKPTVGLVPGDGIVPISHSQDTAGPMARTVADAAALLTAIAHRAADGSEGEPADYTLELGDGSLDGVRIGVLRNFLDFHPLVDERIEEAIAALREAGAEIVDELSMELEEYYPHGYQILLYEFKDGLNRYLASLEESPVRTLEEVIAFNDENAEQEMPWFGQEILLESQAKGGLDEQEYVDALAKAEELRVKYLGLLEEHSLTCFLGPTGGPPWTTDWVNGDHFGGSSSTPAAMTGFANITVPAGYIHGLPVGVSFFAGPWSESTLLKVAYGFEQATQPPTCQRLKRRITVDRDSGAAEVPADAGELAGGLPIGEYGPALEPIQARANPGAKSNPEPGEVGPGRRGDGRVWPRRREPARRVLQAHKPPTWSIDYGRGARPPYRLRMTQEERGAF